MEAVFNSVMTDDDYAQLARHIEFLNLKLKQINEIIDPILAKKVYLGSREPHKTLKAIITTLAETYVPILQRIRTKGQNYNLCTISQIYSELVNDKRVPDLLSKLKIDQLNTIFAEITTKKAEVEAACAAIQQKYAKEADNKKRAEKEQIERLYKQQVDAYVETYREYDEILRILYDIAYRLIDSMPERNTYVIPLAEHINILEDAIRHRKIIQLNPMITAYYARLLFEQAMFYNQNPERVKAELKAWTEFQNPTSEAWKSAHPWLRNPPVEIYKQFEALYAQMRNEYKEQKVARKAAAKAAVAQRNAAAAVVKPKVNEPTSGVVAPGAFYLGEPVKNIYNERQGWIENPEYNTWMEKRAANMYRSKFNIPESYEMHAPTNGESRRRRRHRSRRNRRSRRSTRRASRRN